MNLFDTVKAAVHPRMAADFGTAEQKPSILARLQRGKSQAEAERRCFRMLGDYLRILQDWKTNCAPRLQKDGIDPRFEEACRMLECTQYMVNLLTVGSSEDRREMAADMMKDNKIALLEERLREIREEADEQG